MNFDWTDCIWIAVIVWIVIFGLTGNKEYY